MQQRTRSANRFAQPNHFAKAKRPTLRAALFAVTCTLQAATLPACDDNPPPIPPEVLSAANAPPTETPALPTALPAEATDAGTDANSDAASDAASIAALAGNWEGAYDAKKGRVAMPNGVKDDARTAEDGKASSGPGLIQLKVAPDGDVTGKSEGALGKASVRGKVDGKMLRASFLADDPLSPRAMTGVLIGFIKGDVITAELRVAGPDALVVRQANFDIKKKQ